MTDLTKLTSLLEQTLDTYQADRKIAKANYDMLVNQLESIHGDEMYMSEDGKLEKEVNNALRLYLDAGKRLEKVVEILTRIIIEKLNNESKEKVASILTTLNKDQGYIDNAIDVSMLKHNKKTIDYEKN